MLYCAILTSVLVQASGGSEIAPGGNILQVSAATLSTSGSAVDNSVFILGEPLTGQGQNAFFTLEVGAAPVLALAGASLTPGDADEDGDVDLVDYEVFVDCLNGPGLIPDPPPPQTAQDCLDLFDFDADGDVDLLNFASFQASFTG